MGICNCKSKKSQKNLDTSIADQLISQTKSSNLRSQDSLLQDFLENYTIFRQKKKENSKVFKAKHIKLQTTVQIRIQTKIWYNYNRKNLKILKEYSHPTLIPILGLYQSPENDEEIYIVEEKTQMKSLLQILKQQETNKNLIKTIIKQILQVLAYLSQINLSHCALNLNQLSFMNERYCQQIQLRGINFQPNFFTGSKLKEILPNYETYFKAPELFKKHNLSEQDYQKCDVWACGVILYFLCCGSFPFEGSSEAELINEIKKGVVNFEYEKWIHVDKKARDLVNRMLQFNKNRRETAKQLLQHEWFKNENSSNEQQKINKIIQKDMIYKIKRFKTQVQNKLSEACLNMLINFYSSPQEKEKLANIFHKLDLNQDGKISAQEFKQGIDQVIDEKNLSKIDEVFKLIDQNGDQELEFQEFMRAFIDRQKFWNKENILMIFDSFDKDGSGYLSYSEIKLLLSSMNTTDVEIKKIIKAVDVNKDGKISKNEFLTMMKESLYIS